MNAQEVPIFDAWRVGIGKDEQARALIIKFEDLEKKRAFLAKRRALKDDKIYMYKDLMLA